MSAFALSSVLFGLVLCNALLWYFDLLPAASAIERSWFQGTALLLAYVVGKIWS